jgi:Sporulation and spore germination
VNKRTRTLSLLGIGILVVAIGAAFLFFYDATHAPSQVQTPQTPATPQVQSPDVTPQTPESTSIPVKVFFSKHPASDDDPTKTFPVDRTSPDSGVAVYAISQLLTGPTAQETSQGYFSTVRVRNDASNCGDSDFTITIKDTVATLRFCRTFDAVGTMSDGQAQETIKATLLQFSTIKKVIILTKDGNCQFDMSGENRCLM